MLTMRKAMPWLPAAEYAPAPLSVATVSWPEEQVGIVVAARAGLGAVNVSIPTETKNDRTPIATRYMARRRLRRVLIDGAHESSSEMNARRRKGVRERQQQSGFFALGAGDPTQLFRRHAWAIDESSGDAKSAGRRPSDMMSG
jgi:hypothetical protein